MSEAMLRDGVRLPTLDEGTRCITEAELRDGFDIIDRGLAAGAAAMV